MQALARAPWRGSGGCRAGGAWTRPAARTAARCRATGRRAGCSGREGRPRRRQSPAGRDRGVGPAGWAAVACRAGSKNGAVPSRWRGKPPLYYTTPTTTTHTQPQPGAGAPCLRRQQHSQQVGRGVQLGAGAQPAAVHGIAQRATVAVLQAGRWRRWWVEWVGVRWGWVGGGGGHAGTLAGRQAGSAAGSANEKTAAHPSQRRISLAVRPAGP